MNKKIESPANNPPAQSSWDLRTEQQLIESIQEKRRKDLPLDEKEATLVARQMREDQEELSSPYRR